MIETGLRPAQHARAAGGGAAAAGRGKSRLGTRLWALLHAQALLRGTISGAGGAWDAEDDRRRLGTRRGESNHIL